MGQQLVLDGVLNQSPSTKQGLLQRLFAVWFDAFVYNQIWEDPRVDVQALELDGDSRVLTISSGGCNALNYLLNDPGSVTAVDLNRHHIALLDLKIAAIRYLPDHNTFFDFFGVGRSDKALRHFEKYIAPNIDDEMRRYWLSRSILRRPRIDIFSRGGLYDHSRNGYFLRFFHRFADLFGCHPARVLTAETAEEQKRLFDRHISPFFDNIAIKLIGRMPVTMFGLGIPPQQYDELRKELSGGRTIIDVYRERVRRLACDFPIGENYFAWQAFARKYDVEKRIAVPDYLKVENYETLKSRIGRVETRNGSVTDEIRRGPVGKYNRFVFLDAQDWMNAEAIEELWSLIAERGRPGSRIIFRTAGSASPVDACIPVSLRSRFTYERGYSEGLFKQDRASIYGGIHLYILQ
jgi:S-adenosylmethionine-diacylglycerol 3-amino-3-carboxypropyl transferase